MHYPNQIDQLDSHAERLHQFVLAAAVVIDELIALVPPTLSAENDQENSDMLRRYNDLVQEIRKKANEHNLTGLQSICAMVENNMLILQDNSHSLSDDEIDVLREWPERLFAYLMNQGDIESSTAFLKHLSDVWPICLPEESMNDHLQLLMGEPVSPIPAEGIADTVPDTGEAVTDTSFDAGEDKTDIVSNTDQTITDTVFDAEQTYTDTVFDVAEAETDTIFDVTETVTDTVFESADAAADVGPDSKQTAPEAISDITETVTDTIFEPDDAVVDTGPDSEQTETDAILDGTVTVTDTICEPGDAVVDTGPDSEQTETDAILDDTETVTDAVFESGEALSDIAPEFEQPVPDTISDFTETETDTIFESADAIADMGPDSEQTAPETISDFTETETDTIFESGDAVADMGPDSEQTAPETISDFTETETDTIFESGDTVADTVPDSELTETDAILDGTESLIDTLFESGEALSDMAADFEQIVSDTISNTDQTEADTGFDTAKATTDTTSDIGEVVTDTVSDAAETITDTAPNIEQQQIDSEMISLLASELALLDEQFHGDLAAASHGTEEERAAALTNYLDFLERLKFTVESVGLTALASFVEQLIQKIQSLNAVLSSGHQALLQQLPDLLAAYLAEPNLAVSGSSLLALLTDSIWPTPLADSSVKHWQEALANVQITESTPSDETREVHAKPEDVSLTIPDDVHPELLNGLLLELPVQVSAFSEAIESISLGKGSATDLERAMRAAHTLKGAANTVGVTGIANLTHHLEDILAALLNAKKLPQRTLSDLLINAGDCLETMSEFLQGMGPAPQQTLEVLQQVLDCANQIDKLINDADLPEMADPNPTDKDNSAEPEQPGQQSTAPQAVAEQSLRIPAPLVDELLRISGETLTTNSQIQERLHQSINQTDLIHKQHKLLQQLVVELEELVDIRGISAPLLAREKKTDDFDDLEFEHYNELHTVTRRLMEATTDAQELTNSIENQLSALGESLDDQHRLQIDNQNAVIRIRMVTVNSVVSRLKRGVRQTARLLDKSVDFTIKGENTSIDGNVLNDLMDPLMHILRNAVDHGIESTEERVAAGKSPEGHIELTFAREGNSIVVRCSDDGRGLNYEAILSSAERKNMLQPEYNYSNEELERLILLPGFSTRGTASQVSGRGVGMDVVHSRIQEKKGILTLNSRSNQGLTVELRLPATLLATHTLIVRQREKYLAISSRNIEDIRYCMRDQMLQIGPRQFFQADENMCQLDKLENLLSMPHDRRAEYMDGFPVLLTRLNDGTMHAILVQEILDSREVVMKKFGHYVPRTQGVVGAVILGNGNIAPVIDLVELMQTPAEQYAMVKNPALASSDMEDIGPKALRALVVDDSLSARRAMTQVLTDAGYEVRTANDGLAAVDILSKFIPDIILSDMEMPRMNGLELAAHVRYSERTRHIPVIMITSRSTEKHRQMSSSAGVNLHIVKPFSDDALLDHVARLTAQ